MSLAVNNRHQECAAPPSYSVACPEGSNKVVDIASASVFNHTPESSPVPLLQPQRVSTLKKIGIATLKTVLAIAVIAAFMFATYFTGGLFAAAVVGGASKGMCALWGILSILSVSGALTGLYKFATLKMFKHTRKNIEDTKEFLLHTFGAPVVTAFGILYVSVLALADANRRNNYSFQF